MTLSEFFKIKPRGHRLVIAKKLSCNPTYLSHLSTGFRRASPRMAIEIEKVTNGQVTRYDLRTDAIEIWGPKLK